MKKYIAFAAAAVLSVITPLHAAEPAQNVVEIAAGNKDFSTLVAAVKAAGLAETLSGKGPFTVFAPTDAAFAKLPKGTVEDLLKPENKAKLAAILTYHVVGAKVMAADVKPGKVKTVNGKEFEVKVTDGKVTVDGATVVKTDIVGTNGVIHVIDAVILPKAE
jgi:transforming growth factor-beta-induced protein